MDYKAYSEEISMMIRLVRPEAEQTGATRGRLIVAVGLVRASQWADGSWEYSSSSAAGSCEQESWEALSI
jgi:hypothetical protein